MSKRKYTDHQLKTFETAVVNGSTVKEAALLADIHVGSAQLIGSRVRKKHGITRSSKRRRTSDAPSSEPPILPSAPSAEPPILPKTPSAEPPAPAPSAPPEPPILPATTTAAAEITLSEIHDMLVKLADLQAEYAAVFGKMIANQERLLAALPATAPSNGQPAGIDEYRSLMAAEETKELDRLTAAHSDARRDYHGGHESRADRQARLEETRHQNFAAAREYEDLDDWLDNEY